MPYIPAQVLVISLLRGEAEEEFEFLDRSIHLRRIACNGDEQAAKRLIQAYDGKVAVIALEGMPAQLQLSEAQTSTIHDNTFRNIAKLTPVVDGSDIRDAFERWSLYLMGEMQAGLFNQKHVLFVPGLNYSSALHAITHYTSAIRFADPGLFFRFFPVLQTSNKYITRMLAPAFLQVLKHCDRAMLRQPKPRRSSTSMQKLLGWADIIVGDIITIVESMPTGLHKKTLIVEYADEEQIEIVKRRGAAQIFTLMPPLVAGRNLGCLSIAALNGVLRSTLADAAIKKADLVNLLTKHNWQPGHRVFRPEYVAMNRFAFVIHPLDIKGIHAHPLFRWTRFFPDALVEFIAAYMPPMFIARLRGGKSPVTGQRIEGDIYAVVATPRQMMLHNPRLTYKRINRISRLAERRGARIMGLGAFTSVVGDAGVTIAHESNIAVTSGNSLTAAAAIDALKWAAEKMQLDDISQCKAMVLGATGSIGAVCARWLAEQVNELVLVSPRPEKLLHLKQKIETETPHAKLGISLNSAEALPECDLIICATSAFGQRVLDISHCKPGAVICDVARPHDISPEEAALRPDVLVIDGGEVQIPGDIKIGYDIGLPPGVVYACMAETALLAMSGRFEDYTLGRELDLAKVKEIHALYQTHQFRLSALHCFGRALTEQQVTKKCKLATALRNDAVLLHHNMDEAAEKISHIKPSAKGVAAHATPPRWLMWLLHKSLKLFSQPLRLLLRH